MMLKNRTYYAIKFGNGVKNIIVDSNEDLDKYVNSEYSVFKEFRSYHAAKEYLETTSSIESNLIKICEQIYNKKQETNKIQRKFRFPIPGYIMDGIIEHDSYANIKALILLAVANRGITAENAQKLREYLEQGDYANES